jgi:hypothetical protein
MNDLERTFPLIYAIARHEELKKLRQRDMSVHVPEQPNVPTHAWTRDSHPVSHCPHGQKPVLDQTFPYSFIGMAATDPLFQHDSNYMNLPVSDDSWMSSFTNPMKTLAYLNVVHMKIDMLARRVEKMDSKLESIARTVQDVASAFHIHTSSTQQNAETDNDTSEDGSTDSTGRPRGSKYSTAMHSDMRLAVLDFISNPLRLTTWPIPAWKDVPSMLHIELGRAMIDVAGRHGHPLPMNLAKQQASRKYNRLKREFKGQPRPQATTTGVAQPAEEAQAFDPPVSSSSVADPAPTPLQTPVSRPPSTGQRQGNVSQSNMQGSRPSHADRAPPARPASTVPTSSP